MSSSPNWSGKTRGLSFAASEAKRERSPIHRAAACSPYGGTSKGKKAFPMAMLRPDLPGIDDTEGERIPDGLPPVIDAHVHIFPDNIFSAIWAWFDENAWPIRYRLSSSGAIAYLLSHGVSRVVALQYAHRPGISRMLNQHMVESCREFPGRVTGMAAVFPGEQNAEKVLKEAFAQGLVGVKLHAHVQCFDMNAEEMDVIYDLCQSEHKPMFMISVSLSTSRW
jgi:uncharacterized protein